MNFLKSLQTLLHGTQSPAQGMVQNPQQGVPYANPQQDVVVNTGQSQLQQQTPQANIGQARYGQSDRLPGQPTMNLNMPIDTIYPTPQQTPQTLNGGYIQGFNNGYAPQGQNQYWPQNDASSSEVYPQQSFQPYMQQGSQIRRLLGL